MQRRRLLVLASTYPARAGDGTPAFVRDLAAAESSRYETTVLVPSVPGSVGAEVDGTLDASFGDGGVVVTSISTNTDGAQDVDRKSVV